MIERVEKSQGFGTKATGTARVLGLILLTQVVAFHVSPDSLSHLRGGNLLALATTQYSRKVTVQLDPVSSEGSSLIWRQVHLPEPR